MAKEFREKVTLKLPEGAIGIRTATCPNGCDLMDRSVMIHGLPSIRVRCKGEGKEGTLNLDPLYGSFDNIEECRLPEGTVVDFACPSCGASLRSTEETCRTCAAPLFIIQIPKGIVEACSRRGCHYHRMTIVDTGELMDRLFAAGSQDSYL